MATLVQDVRFAVRTLSKSPGFIVIAVVCLSLGIGVNGAIFSLLDSIALRPLPFPDPDHLVVVGSARATTPDELDGASYPDLVDWRQGTRSFESLSAVERHSFSISDRTDAERLDGAFVSWDLFMTLGIQPILGRPFRPEEDAPGGAPVVLLSHGVWQRRFGSDPSIAGRPIVVDGASATVVGVMPPRFAFPDRASIWMPVTPAVHEDGRQNRDLLVFARLKPRVALGAARADVAAAASHLASEHPEDKDWTASVRTISDEFLPKGDALLMVSTMMGAVTFVLLIACGNVANLLLARATVRQREIAVRTALGANRGRIVRQLLTESLMIAFASVPLGVAIAFAGLRWLTAAVPKTEVPYFINWDLNSRVILYTIAIAAGTGLVFGLAPALQAAKPDLVDSLKDGGRGTGAGAPRMRLRNALVVGEIALALVVLVGASLFVRTFVNFERARAGLPTRGLMTMRVFMAGDQYSTPEARIRRVEDLVRRVEALPGVIAVTASGMVPFNGGAGGAAVVPEGVTIEKGQEPGVLFMGVTPHLLKTLDQPLIAGRDFTDAEGIGRSQVAIVNQVFAKRLWPKLPNTVGQRFRLVSETSGVSIAVIGVVNDFRLFTVRDGKPAPYAFVSYPYDASRTTGLTIRVAGAAPSAITGAVRDQIRQSDSTLAVYDVRSGDEARANSYWQFRLFGWMFSSFGVVALALAAVGVYGMLAYSVSQRTHEIGVRMALGASRGNVFRVIVSQGATLAAIGIGIGLVGALGATRIIASQLYNVSATDPLSFAGTALFLVLVALAASYVPARRATAVDPMIALRTE